MTHSHRDTFDTTNSYDRYADSLADQSDAEIASYLQKLERTQRDERFRWRRPEKKRQKARRRHDVAYDWANDDADWYDYDR